MLAPPSHLCYVHRIIHRGDRTRWACVSGSAVPPPTPTVPTGTRAPRPSHMQPAVGRPSVCVCSSRRERTCACHARHAPTHCTMLPSRCIARCAERHATTADLTPRLAPGLAPRLTPYPTPRLAPHPTPRPVVYSASAARSLGPFRSSAVPALQESDGPLNGDLGCLFCMPRGRCAVRDAAVAGAARGRRAACPRQLRVVGIPRCPDA
jgi:hypothetical protein